MNFAARFRKAFYAAFDVLIRRYVRGVIYFCRHRVLTWGILIASMVLLVVLMRTTKTGLVADETLPKGYSYEFGGITREESQSTGNTVLIFAICFVLVYLILSALYESFLVPFAVVLALPFGLFGSFLFAKFMGLENNIYMQTGLIMLIGLLAKTAILITEYAVKRREAGMSLIQAAVGAAKVRLRPILMTALTMVFGLLPLMVSTGVGANGNRTLGSGAVGGMLVGTLALLFIVPALFIVFQWLQEQIRPVQAMRSDEWAIRAEIEELQKQKKEKRSCRR